MSSLVDHLDNNHSDADENDHINKLFPKCKPRNVGSNDTTGNLSSGGSRWEKSKAELLCVNNNLVVRAGYKNCVGKRDDENYPQVNNEHGLFAKDENTSLKTETYSNSSFRCSAVPEKNVLDNGNHRLPSKSSRVKKDSNYYQSSIRSNYNRSSSNKIHGGYEILPTDSTAEESYEEKPNQIIWNHSSKGYKYAALPDMDTEHLDDHFDNGIGSGASSGSNNSSTFSQSSCSFTNSSGGESKTCGASLSSSGLGSSTGSVTMVPTPGSGLRDSRIEIAGGREVYSQNRIKAGRRVRGSTSMESMLVHQQGGGNKNCGGSSSHLKSSSSSSQLASKSCKGRRKSTNFPSSSNPLLSPTSSSPGNVWEPYRSSGAGGNRKSIPLSPSSTSSSLSRQTIIGGGVATAADQGNNYVRRCSNASASVPSSVRHSQSKSSLEGPHGGRSNRTAAFSQSYYYPSECEFDLSQKSSSLDEMSKSCSMPTFTNQHSCNLGVSPTSSNMTLKETVFDSEITSIEKPVEIAAGNVARPKFVYESSVKRGGEIVFDDIGDQWARQGRGDENGKKSGKDLTPGGMECRNMEQLNFLDSLIPEHGSGVEHEEHEGQLLQDPMLDGHFEKRRPSNQGGYESDECASNNFIPEQGEKTCVNEGNKRLIGNIPIAEYEGSPKRYGLRLPTQLNPNHLELIDPSTHAIAHLNVTSTTLSSRLQSPSSAFSAGSKVPGFPHRVDTSGSGSCVPGPTSCSSTPPMSNLGISCESIDKSAKGPPLDADHKLEAINQVNSGSDNLTSSSALVSNSSQINQAVVPTLLSSLTESKEVVTSPSGSHGAGPETVDASPDDSVMSQQGSNNTSRSLEDQDQDLNSHQRLPDNHDDYLLYEFSETRKVLEEFFRPSDASYSQQMEGIQRNFDELDYTLKRQAGNSYVGQRLAGENSIEQSEESPKKPQRRTVLLNVTNEGVASPKLISFQEVTSPLSRNSFTQSAVSPAKPTEPPSGLQHGESSRDMNDNDIDADTASSNTETDLGDTEVGLQVGHSRNFTLSPETTDCDSNELESELSLDYEASIHSSSRLGGGIMPILEDGLSSGNLSDNDERDDEDDDDEYQDRKRSLGVGRKKCYHLKNSSSGVNNLSSDPNPTLMLMKKQISEIEKEIKLRSQRVAHADPVVTGNFGINGKANGPTSNSGATKTAGDSAPGIHIQPCGSNASKTLSDIHSVEENYPSRDLRPEANIFDCNDPELEALDPMRPTPPPSPAPCSMAHPRVLSSSIHSSSTSSSQHLTATNSHSLPGRVVSFTANRSNEPPNMSGLSSSNGSAHGSSTLGNNHANPIASNGTLTAAGSFGSKVGITGDIGFLHESSTKVSQACDTASTNPEDQLAKDVPETLKNGISPRSNFSDSDATSPTVFSQPANFTSSNAAQSAQQSSDTRIPPLMRDSSPVWVPRHPSAAAGNHSYRSNVPGVRDPLLRKQRYDENQDDEADTDQETDRLLGQNRTEDDYGFYDEKEKEAAKKKRNKEGLLENTSVLIEGVLFRARYLGSTQLVCEGQPTKATRMIQAEEAVSRIKGGGSQNGSIYQPSGNPSVDDDTEAEESSVRIKSIGGGSCKNTLKSDGSYAFTPTVGVTASGSGGRQSAKGDKNGLEDDDEEEDEDRDDDPDSDENSMEEDDFCLGSSEKGPRGVVGGVGLVDNTFSTEDKGMVKNGGRRMSSSEISNVGPPTSSPSCGSFLGAAPTFGGSLPHLSPPCGSALPGTMFRLRFVGSLEVEEEVGSGRRRRKRPKKTMVEEAVLKLKAPEGETQPSTEVDLFISTEKIMVLNTDLKEIMMDHALRTISYIADIGDLVVLMARRRPVPSDTVEDSKMARPPKMICHVFESDEAQYIAQSIGQAFQVAYMEFLKANGIEDHSFVREMDYQEVLNSQEIFGDELQMFAKKELQKEVVVPKAKGEILGVVIVESGWGSMLPTVVIANLAPAGAAARCGQLNIGDQIIAINGVSLVGLPLSTCQNYIKNTKNQTVVKLTVVPCPPVVEVKIKRPDTKYQLGFSVQNGVICSLLRGGIAERGGVRVGHRIIEINNQSVVAVPHEKIVNLLATSVGEINMKTMPTSMFRLLTGQETPLYI